MRRVIYLATLVSCAALSSCGGGGSGGSGGGNFQLIEFLQAGQDRIARNAVLTFRFTEPVDPAQDLFERLKIQNIQSGAASSSARAIGTYVLSGDAVTFVPKYPELVDRSDAGLRANGSYHVFLKSGADSLRSTAGAALAFQQEFLFNTGVDFDDILPNDPPRALALLATDPTTGLSLDISRVDPRPNFLALADNATLINFQQNGSPAPRMIEPGAGGAPNYATPWQFDLVVSEPLDPGSVTGSSVQLLEVRNNAFPGAGDVAPAGWFGTAVSFRVPIVVSVVQRLTPAGLGVFIRVVPQQTLVDDARYRIVFSGGILGIDTRRTFIGDNGLTGDGQTLVGGAPFSEVGGAGYTSEFLVVDRAPVRGQRVVEYDPLADGIQPELGPTTVSPANLNSALYNPAPNPGRAVGFLGAFGDGRDGNMAVAGGNTVTLDTGDTTTFIGNPFSVIDVDPNDVNSNNGLPTPGPRTFDSKAPREWQLQSLTISASATLRIIGLRPARMRVAGLVQIAGILDAGGGNGANGTGGNAAAGIAGAGGFPGGEARPGLPCASNSGNCTSFDTYLNACPNSKAGYPFAKKGAGPGRGHNGGEIYGYDYADHLNVPTQRVSGTGGGGGSHATKGTNGEDTLNASGSPGTPGPACSINWNFPTGGVIGVRSTSGPIYGDREVVLTLIGGSGGGAGGGIHRYQSFGTVGSGGAGGGGGGIVEIVASGAINVNGIIDVSGGNGGKGSIFNQGGTNFDQATGSGGGGAGGSIVLISGDRLVLSGSLIDARGGAGGIEPNIGTAFATCANCNSGGAGGKGFILLMDSDGAIEGILPGTPGNYDTYVNGVLSIRSFDAGRFSSITAVTELFNVRAADPDFQPLDVPGGDIVGIVAVDQRILVSMSSATASSANPLAPDPTTETGAVLVAKVQRAGGSTVVVPVPGAMDSLDTPERDAFVRVLAAFEYDVGVQAAIGPFAMMDRVRVTFTFN